MVERLTADVIPLVIAEDTIITPAILWIDDFQREGPDFSTSAPHH